MDDFVKQAFFDKAARNNLKACKAESRQGREGLSETEKVRDWLSGFVDLGPSFPIIEARKELQ